MAMVPVDAAGVVRTDTSPDDAWSPLVPPERTEIWPPLPTRAVPAVTDTEPPAPADVPNEFPAATKTLPPFPR